MYKVISHTILFISAIILWGCDKPAPTELLDDNQVEVEIISQDIDDEYYNTGFDTTGVIETPVNYTNLLTVSGIKSKVGRRQSEKTSFAQTIFFDRNYPVYTDRGKLLGYETRIPGIVKFNDITARREQYRVMFRGQSGPRDTLLGFRLVLNSGKGMHSERFDFEYASSVKFEFIPEGSDNSFVINIPTPPEITAEAIVTGSFAAGDMSVKLEWNGNRSEDFEVVVNGIKTRNDVVPLFRIKTDDDGNLIIPPTLINMIPRDKFNNLDFSLIRKIEFNNNDRLDIHIISQSIHRLILDSP